VTKSFWTISLGGNFALFVHALIQGQFLICVVQSVNAMIAARNLNLMQKKQLQWSYKTVGFCMAVSILLPLVLF
jgi:lipid-A-disaccharide synthase-like uncharacterized protein